MTLLDRAEAGRRLADQLADRPWLNPVVLALPPGGVPMGWDIARRLKAPLDVISALEVVIPGEHCVRIGAVSNGVFVTGMEKRAASSWGEDYVRRLVDFDIQKQLRHEAAYRRSAPRLDLRKRDAILVDDGWATPDMILAAIEALRRRGSASITYATPQCQTETYARLAPEVALLSLYPRGRYRTVLLVDKGVRHLAFGDVADIIRESRRSLPVQAEPLMKAMPGLSAASQASRVA